MSPTQQNVDKVFSHTKLKFFDCQYGFWRSEVAFYGDMQVKGQVSQKTLR